MSASSVPSAAQFDGDLLLHENSSLLASARYSSDVSPASSWIVDLITRLQSSSISNAKCVLDECIQEAKEKFDEEARRQEKMNKVGGRDGKRSRSQQNGNGGAATGNGGSSRTSNTATSNTATAASASIESVAASSTSVTPALSSSLASFIYPPPPPIPVLPHFSRTDNLSTRLRHLQSYLRSYEYNHLGYEFHPVNKTRSFSFLMQQAREIVTQAYPIKCLEAVLVAMYLTNSVKEWMEIHERITLRFKTRLKGVANEGGRSYWHIVLVISDGTHYGSVGLSRRETLDYRPLSYPSLSSLITSFRVSYEEVSHELEMIMIGLDLPKKEERMFWHFLKLPVLNEGVMREMRQKNMNSTSTKVYDVEQEWTTLLSIVDRFSTLSSSYSTLLRRTALTHSSSSSTSAIPLPLATLKKLEVHERVVYDQKSVALVWKPEWKENGERKRKRRKKHTKTSNGAAARHTSTVAAAATSDSDDTSDSSSASSSSSSSSESGDDNSDIEATPHPAKSPSFSPMPICVTSPIPSSALSSSTATQNQRALERIERKQNQALVEALKERYRTPTVTTTISSSSSSSSSSAYDTNHMNGSNSSSTHSTPIRSRRSNGGSTFSPSLARTVSPPLRGKSLLSSSPTAISPSIPILSAFTPISPSPPPLQTQPQQSLRTTPQKRPQSHRSTFPPPLTLVGSAAASPSTTISSSMTSAATRIPSSLPITSSIAAPASSLTNGSRLHAVHSSPPPLQQQHRVRKSLIAQLGQQIVDGEHSAPATLLPSIPRSPLPASTAPIATRTSSDSSILSSSTSHVRSLSNSSLTPLTQPQVRASHSRTTSSSSSISIPSGASVSLPTNTVVQASE